jgi:phosphoribosylformimino-5-aminoimidazole carboxamide ribotide isomerase
MIIPAIDLIEGSVVRLYQGDYAQKTEYKLDPIDVVHSYADQGAKWLHIVDLTGAKDTNKRQLELIGKMVATGRMHFQAGGGIRSEEDVKQLLDIGVKRVVIGSLAVKEPELVKGWLKKYGPDAIVLALDISRDGTLQGANHQLYTEMTKQFPSVGWQASGGIGNLNDIAVLKPTNVNGVILGRALLEGKFTVEQAIECWNTAK